MSHAKIVICILRIVIAGLVESIVTTTTADAQTFKAHEPMLVRRVSRRLPSRPVMERCSSYLRSATSFILSLGKSSQSRYRCHKAHTP
eukprot:6204502-Pleurochrysis_carterae.AAC.3